MSFTSSIGKQALHFSMLHVTVLLNEFFKNKKKRYSIRVCVTTTSGVVAGFWLFHCHVDFHMHLGLSMVIQVGEPHEMVPAPTGFPRCGSWNFASNSGNDAAGICDNLTSSATHSLSSVVPFQLLCIISCCLIFFIN